MSISAPTLLICLAICKFSQPTHAQAPKIGSLKDFCVIILRMPTLENCTCQHFFDSTGRPGPFCPPQIQLTTATPGESLVEFCKTRPEYIADQNCTCQEIMSIMPRDQLPSSCKKKSTLQEYCDAIGERPTNCTCAKYKNSEFCTADEPVPYIYVMKYDAVSEQTRAGIVAAVSVAGIFGNFIVVAISLLDRKRIGRYRFLIGILASCDMLFALLHLVIVIPRFWTKEWLYGRVMCKIFAGLLDLGAFLAIGIILIIAIERYIGIVQPFKRGLSRVKTYALLVVNLIVGISWVLPLVLVTDVHSGTNTCTETWSLTSTTVYSYLNLIVYFTLPVIIIAFLYIRILSVLRPGPQEKDKRVTEDQQEIEKRKLNNRRITVVLVLVLVAFVICVAPNRIVWVLLAHRGPNHGFSKEALNYAALVLYPFHVAINPIIYCLKDRKMRRDAMKLFCRSCIVMYRRMASRRVQTSGISFSNVSVDTLADANVELK